jgi:anti-sigma factor RsiW
MNCFPELTYSLYVDNELSPEEAHKVEAHRSHCSQCRGLVDALRAEDRLLV